MIGIERYKKKKSSSFFLSLDVLPDPIEKVKGVSFWSMIKDNIGTDLTRVCLPVYFNKYRKTRKKCPRKILKNYLEKKKNKKILF